MLLRKNWLPLMLVVSWASCQVLAQELVTEPLTNEAIELLDQATEKKLFAERMSDLDEVVELCEEALEKGLPEAEQTAARDLIAATLFEKASRVLAPVLEGQIDASWRQRRRMALTALNKAMEVSPDNGEVHLLFAQLADLPGGDREVGKESAEKAVELLADNPSRRCEALLTRASFQDDEEARFADIDQAVKADPTNADAIRERGECHLQADREDQAIADFMQVLELDDEDTDTRELIIQLLSSQEQFDKAVELTNKMIERDESSARGYLLRSGIYALQGNDQQAQADLDKAVEVEPDNLTALLSRAQNSMDREDYEEATADIERALELRPGLPAALLIRSLLSQLQGEFDKAIRDLRRLLRRDPKNVPLRLQIAAIYVMDNRPRKAVEEYTRVIEDDENEWEALRGRGDAYLAFGEHDNAIADYEKALEMAAEDSGILNNLAWVMATSPIDEVRDAKRAIELAEKACQLTDYQAAHILSTLAAGYAEAGNFEEAIKWSTKAVDLGDGDIGEQLAKELESYQQNKPWREKQETEERIEEEQPSLSDLDVGAESAAIPSDP